MHRFVVQISSPTGGRIRTFGEAMRGIGARAGRAHWRHRDGRCIGTVLVEAGDRSAALAAVPAALRRGAVVLSV